MIRHRVHERVLTRFTKVCWLKPHKVPAHASVVGCDIMVRGRMAASARVRGAISWLVGSRGERAGKRGERCGISDSEAV